MSKPAARRPNILQAALIISTPPPHAFCRRLWQEVEKVNGQGVEDRHEFQVNIIRVCSLFFLVPFGDLLNLFISPAHQNRVPSFGETPVIEAP